MTQLTKLQIEEIYYRLFDEEIIKIKFPNYSEFGIFRTRLYEFKRQQDMERDTQSAFTYEYPILTIKIHHIPGVTSVIAVMQFTQRKKYEIEFVEFDEETQTWKTQADDIEESPEESSDE